MEYVHNVLIVCGLTKKKNFSLETFPKERIPAVSREEKKHAVYLYPIVL